MPAARMAVLANAASKTWPEPKRPRPSESSARRTAGKPRFAVQSQGPIVLVAIDVYTRMYTRMPSQSRKSEYFLVLLSIACIRPTH